MPGGPNHSNCRILYFRCVFDQPDLVLQDLLHRALTRRVGGTSYAQDWQRRRYDVTDDEQEGECFLINHMRGYSRPEANNIFGDLCRYRPGAKLAAIIEEDNVPELQVDLLSPRARQQFLRGMMFWRVSGNDIILVQSTTVRFRALQDYLRWFLVDETKVLPASIAFQFDQSIKLARWANPTVKSVSMSATVPSPGTALRGDRAHSGQPTTFGRFSSGIIGALRSVFSDDDRLQRLMDKIPEGEDVSIEISIRLPSAYKVADPIRLEDVTQAVHALTDAHLVAQTETGQVALGQLLQKPEFTARVLSHDGIWDRDDLYHALGKAWTYFREHGFLSA